MSKVQRSERINRSGVLKPTVPVGVITAWLGPGAWFLADRPRAPGVGNPARQSAGMAVVNGAHIRGGRGLVVFSVSRRSSQPTWRIKFGRVPRAVKVAATNPRSLSPPAPTR